MVGRVKTRPTLYLRARTFENQANEARPVGAAGQCELPIRRSLYFRPSNTEFKWKTRDFFKLNAWPGRSHGALRNVNLTLP